MHAGKRARWWIVPACLTAAVGALWVFPKFWFTAQAAAHTKTSLTENRDIKGWIFEEIPISQAAERALVADHIINGEFRSAAGEAIRVFSAKRHTDNPNEIGLFVHTPDRCWVEGGWKLEPSAPGFIETKLHGAQLALERRIFQHGSNKELVYFGGLIDGQVPPYRLDHNLSMAARTALNETFSSATDKVPDSKLHFWQRLWSSFTSRTQLSGPKHFFRISTPIHSERIEQADHRLMEFLRNWLRPAELKPELIPDLAPQ
ncbi:MAG TPA: exosortase-associated EpsI family protein [Verrucomicrobiae bacterium]